MKNNRRYTKGISKKINKLLNIREFYENITSDIFSEGQVYMGKYTLKYFANKIKLTNKIKNKNRRLLNRIRKDKTNSFNNYKKILKTKKWINAELLKNKGPKLKAKFDYKIFKNFK